MCIYIYICYIYIYIGICCSHDLREKMLSDLGLPAVGATGMEAPPIATDEDAGELCHDLALGLGLPELLSQLHSIYIYIYIIYMF